MGGPEGEVSVFIDCDRFVKGFVISKVGAVGVLETAGSNSAEVGESVEWETLTPELRLAEVLGESEETDSTT
jgi:hypothetical protein